MKKGDIMKIYFIKCKVILIESKYVFISYEFLFLQHFSNHTRYTFINISTSTTICTLLGFTTF